MLHGADLAGLRFDGYNLRCASLHTSNLQRSSFLFADLSGANLADADLAFADFTNAILDGALFKGAKLPHVDLRGRNFSRQDLSAVVFTGADLSAIDLSYAVLQQASLQDCHLSGTIRCCVDLWEGLGGHRNEGMRALGLLCLWHTFCMPSEKVRLDIECALHISRLHTLSGARPRAVSPFWR